MNLRKLLGLAALGWILLAACQAGQTGDVAEPAIPASGRPTAASDESLAQVAEPADQPVPQSPESAAPEPAAPIEVRTGLAATDPNSVDLASGTPTLVEFFAFW